MQRHAQCLQGCQQHPGLRQQPARLHSCAWRAGTRRGACHRARAAGPSVPDQLLEARRLDSGEGKTGMSPRVRQIVNRLAEEAKGGKPPEVSEQDVEGDFDGFATDFALTDEQGRSTLGKMSFNQFQPTSIKVQMAGGGLRIGPSSQPGSHQIPTGWEVLEGEYAGLEGLQTAKANWSLEAESQKQIIEFSAFRVEPKDKSPEGLKRWLAAFKEHNENMGEDGVWEMTFPKTNAGWRQFVWLDEQFQVTLGNMGSPVIMQRRSS